MYYVMWRENALIIIATLAGSFAKALNAYIGRCRELFLAASNTVASRSRSLSLSSPPLLYMNTFRIKLFRSHAFAQNKR